MTKQFFHISWSKNSKVGNIPVSTTSADSCPDTCQHKQLGTCYANFSFTKLHWDRVSDGRRATEYSKFLEFIRNLPDGQLWRHNQAGDLPGTGNTVDTAMLNGMVEANTGRRGFTYTHKVNPKYFRVYREANKKGFTINVSADSVKQALAFFKKGLPTVVTLSNADEATGNIVVCPQQTNENLTCAQCQLCYKADRKTIVGFISHGSRRNKWHPIQSAGSSMKLHEAT